MRIIIVSLILASITLAQVAQTQQRFDPTLEMKWRLMSNKIEKAGTQLNGARSAYFVRMASWYGSILMFTLAAVQAENDEDPTMLMVFGIALSTVSLVSEIVAWSKVGSAGSTLKDIKELD